MARAFDMAVTPWSPLAGGILTGKYNKASNGNEPKRLGSGSQPSDRQLSIAAEVVQIAEELGKSASQVALNWLRSQAGVIIPLIGSRKLSQIQDNLACLDFELSTEHLNQLNQVSQIELGFPHDILASEMVNEMVFAGMRDRIDNHRDVGNLNTAAM